MENVVIIDASRTPMGSFGGKLKSLTAPELGAIAIGALYKNNSLNPDVIDEVVMGNVFSAGVGQAPARQAALKAGLSNKTPSSTVNKVCASGMKAIMYAAQQIQTGDADVVVAGGMESMSNVPYYVHSARFGNKLGHTDMQDGIIRDGLCDAFTHAYMGRFAEKCAEKYDISREEQDNYAAMSYRRARRARDEGAFNEEVTPVKIREGRTRAEVIGDDEEMDRVNFDKIPKLSPSFQKEGTVTAANASPISDGAAAVLLMSERKAKQLDLTPVARILSHASTAQEPEWFTTAPSKAIPAALDRAGLKSGDIGLFEINEAFSVVALANMALLDLDPDIVNVHGGAVSMGHPVGCSGARIFVTLIHALRRYEKQRGCAAICNGGGGASAIITELI
ncbi:acetyl-CoA C-acyltransferase [Natronogracilivirga saccharolytica]|uniref:Acetyl-CoA C-acyltransferase n=1 Tax=Natronogracilivirga saccharolytica TaxID=2812953 RepID=A0A8J7RVB2_9BACT|nr:acetyl-CoA C-acyltransferase [Natronogracilivirga saccharolytica]MBP3193617.1 acetyl-CoA C-acyltransferase [Natronogracilivirga saccharolytica]